MYSTEAIGKKTIESPYEKFTIQRGWTSEDDVDIDIKYCGFCHTDVHLARNDWGFSQFPNVPGHEIAGVVTKVRNFTCILLAQFIKHKPLIIFFQILWKSRCNILVSFPSHLKKLHSVLRF